MKRWTLRRRYRRARLGQKGDVRLGTLCLLLGVSLIPAIAWARLHRTQAWADTQFQKAEAAQETLHGKADQARTRREYQTVIEAYRQVVLQAPISTKADGSAFAVAELTAEMGRHFKDDRALYSAVREYKFLRREYPGSKHRIEALLAIGEIYKNDLGDEADARLTFQELLQRYSHSDLVKEARAELDALGTQKVGHGSGDEAAANPARTESDASSAAGLRAKPGPAIANPEDANASSPQTDRESGKIAGVTDVQYWSGPDYTRVTVSLARDVQFKAQRLEHPDRIFFDLKDARLATTLLGQSYDVNDGLINKIRVAQYEPGRARVVVETAGHAAYTASVVSNPPRLVIDVHGDSERDGATPKSASKDDPTAPDDGNRLATANELSRHQLDDAARPTAQDSQDAHDDSDTGGSSSRPTTSVSMVNGVKKVVVEAGDDDSSPDVPVTATKSTKTARGVRRVASARVREAQPTSSGDRSLIRALGLKIGKIVIDPGHGGHDTGTIGPNGLYEKDLVLDVSKRLGKLLEARLGADVVFTRRDDTFIPLETRTSIANQEQADLFVSVHANSSHDPDARGVETYYLNFTSSPDALEVAARENADADKSIHELQDLVKKIALKEKIEESREFASDVQQSLHTGLAAKSPGERDRGVKKAPFVVLIGANMPSILAEISFISNPGDERRLRSPEYRQRIAESLYRGIARYVNGLGGVKVASRLEKASDN